MTRGTGRRTRNRGAVAVEAAVLLWFLLLAAFAVADFWLLFHRMAIVQDCAASGAAAGVALGPSAIQAAVAETAAPDGAAWVDRLPSTPAVATTSGTDANGLSYVQVTVTYTPDGAVFAILSSGTTPISRTVRMMVPLAN